MKACRKIAALALCAVLLVSLMPIEDSKYRKLADQLN